MTITKIVEMINNRMNYDNFPYSDLQVALDAAIDKINSDWRINLPMITDFPEMTKEYDPVTGKPTTNFIPTEYPALPDEFIRQYVVPYVAGKQYIINEQDGSPEMTEAILGLGVMSERYPVKPGQTAILKKDANYNILQEDFTDQFADGHNNYGNPNRDNRLDPLGEY